MCVTRPLLHANVAGHMLQAWVFSPVWAYWWSTSAAIWVKALGHRVHLYALLTLYFLPWWTIRSCFVTSCFLLNSFLQIGQEKGFSLLWEIMCLRNLNLSLNVRLQNLQIRSPSVCSSLCLSSSFSVVKQRSHTSHLKVSSSIILSLLSEYLKPHNEKIRYYWNKTFCKFSDKLLFFF